MNNENESKLEEAVTNFVIEQLKNAETDRMPSKIEALSKLITSIK